MTAAKLPPKITVAKGLEPKVKARADALFDYSVLHPDGWNIDQAATDNGWSYNQVNQAIRYLRKVFADSTITLICTPNGQRNRWIYKLVGTYDDAQPYLGYRMGDIEERMLTIEWMTHSIKNASDLRTLEGKKAKMVYEDLYALRLRLEFLNNEVI